MQRFYIYALDRSLSLASLYLSVYLSLPGSLAFCLSLTVCLSLSGLCLYVCLTYLLSLSSPSLNRGRFELLDPLLNALSGVPSYVLRCDTTQFCTIVEARIEQIEQGCHTFSEID